MMSTNDGYKFLHAGFFLGKRELGKTCFGLGVHSEKQTRATRSAFVDQLCLNNLSKVVNSL